MIGLLFAITLTACGGSSDNNDSDSSFSETFTTETGSVYQCDTENAFNSCSGDDGDCSACTCTANCDSADQDADFSSLTDASAQAIDPASLLKTDFSEQALVEKLSAEFDESTDLSQLALPSAEVAKKTIEKLPPHTLAEHLGRYFKPNDLGLIGDQYQFAQKLAQEYLDENPERAEEASYPSTIHFSLSKQFDVAPATDFQFTKKNRKAAIYAHLNMAPSVVNNSHIFVKWMNLSSGKVMLFNKKRISSRSEQNWVNLRPEKGWKAGAYKVKLYQFDASLTPIVEGQYYVYEHPED